MIMYARYFVGSTLNLWTYSGLEIFLLFGIKPVVFGARASLL